jgi:hypothetical protein
LVNLATTRTHWLEPRKITWIITSEDRNSQSEPTSTVVCHGHGLSLLAALLAGRRSSRRRFLGHRLLVLCGQQPHRRSAKCGFSQLSSCFRPIHTAAYGQPPLAGRLTDSKEAELKEPYKRGQQPHWRVGPSLGDSPADSSINQGVRARLQERRLGYRSRATGRQGCWPHSPRNPWAQSHWKHAGTCW